MKISFCLVSSQVTSKRLAHTDIRYPDFTDYRRDAVKSPSARSRDTAGGRQAVSYLVAAGNKSLKLLYLVDIVVLIKMKTGK